MDLEELIKKSEQLIFDINTALNSPRRNGKATAREEYKAWTAVYFPHLLQAVKDLKHKEASDVNLISYLEDEVRTLRSVIAHHNT